LKTGQAKITGSCMWLALAGLSLGSYLDCLHHHIHDCILIDTEKRLML